MIHQHPAHFFCNFGFSNPFGENSTESLELNTTTLDILNEIIRRYGEMDIFIGSRMHSTIFALTAGVNTIGLAYQPKTLGTFERLSISEYCMPISEFSSKDLLKLMIKCSEGKYPSLNIGSHNKSFVESFNNIING